VEAGLSTVRGDTGQWAGRSGKRGLNPGRGQSFICPPEHPDHFRGPPTNFLFAEYRMLSRRVRSGWVEGQTTPIDCPR